MIDDCLSNQPAKRGAWQGCYSLHPTFHHWEIQQHKHMNQASGFNISSHQGGHQHCIYNPLPWLIQNGWPWEERSLH